MMSSLDSHSGFRFEPIERKTIVTEITRRLLDYLFSGELKPGDKLPAERQLSDAIGVGRSSLREALKALTVLGLLEVRQGDGTYLKKAHSDLLPQVIEWGILLGEKSTADLVEAREKIEIVIAGLAAERRTPQQLAELGEILKQMQAHAQNKDTKAYTEADVAFHFKLAEMAQNAILSGILSSIRSLLRVWIISVIESAGDAQFSYDEHTPIYEAVERGDAALAQRRMEEHMKSASGMLKDLIRAAEEGYEENEQSDTDGG
jgi:GntR family transcriptional repressor for pyruvate dehydrogenase complex